MHARRQAASSLTVREDLAKSSHSPTPAFATIRAISYLLHPPLCSTNWDWFRLSGLIAEGYAERTGLEIDLDLPANSAQAPQAIEIALFRIVQEGLANIHRHSGSRTAAIHA